MSAEVLTSDRLNYLIWRYLQESGHGEAAVKFQRDWTSDPQRLPCAQYIGRNALIVLVQKGLQYHEIEQSIINQNNQGTRSSPAASTFFFGPQSDRANSTPKEDGNEKDGADTAQNFPPTRKHGRENSITSLPLDLPNSAPPAKRTRRSNGTDAANGDRRERDRDVDSDSVDYEASGYLQNEPPEPTSNINSPTAESPAVPGGDGAGDGTGDGEGDGGGMDVDDDDAPAPASASEHAPAPAPAPALVPSPIPARMTLTLTNGQSVGVQSDKVTELGPETITLSVPDKNVMHTVWNPRHTDILAAGGLGLCRIGTISRSPAGTVAPASDPQPPPTEPAEPPEPLQLVNPEQQIQDQGQDPNANPNPWQYVDVLDPSDNTSMVSTMAWSPDGEILAVATQPGITGTAGAVTLKSKGGESIDEVPWAHDMVLKFLWNPSGTYLMWISTSGRESSTVVVWNLRSSQALPPFPLNSVILDAAWADDRSLTLCGHDIIVEAVIDEDTIVARHTRTDFDEEVRWANIQIDSLTRTTAVTAEEPAILGIIDASGDLRKTIAHEAEITALVFQPVPNSSLPSSSPRLLATSSLDGTIKIWDARNPFTIIHVLSLGRSTPALAISFTPDGCFVAAANWHRIMIWNADAGGMPKASWKGELSKWQNLPNGVDKDSGIGEEEDGSTHSLSWDADGKKLAYGLGSQIAIIDFLR